MGNKELHAYVNYAHGDENLQEVYGHQSWRLQRLRAMKRRTIRRTNLDSTRPSASDDVIAFEAMKSSHRFNRVSQWYLS